MNTKDRRALLTECLRSKHDSQCAIVFFLNSSPQEICTGTLTSKRSSKLGLKFVLSNKLRSS